jgi:hypothetical protein
MLPEAVLRVVPISDRQANPSWPGYAE